MALRPYAAAKRTLSAAEKLGEMNWGLVLLICIIAIAGIAMRVSGAGARSQPWENRQIGHFGLGLTGEVGGCYMRDGAVHKLVSYKDMPILSLSAEGTYHRVVDVCIPKWLNQAGAKDDFVRLEDAGIRGNMHEMFLDRNSQDVIKYIDGWVNKKIK